jgi:predicted dithiol-disulfide oxidoreductase (DUF899 family)
MLTGNLPDVVSMEDWLEARKELLRAEKELLATRDRLNADRRRLPMVRIDKAYIFEGPDGPVSLIDLFEGRHQLVMHHFMWTYEDVDGVEVPRDTPCPNCAASADGISQLAQLHVRNTTLVAVSRVPYPKIAAFRDRMGWTFPWYSSFGSDFNYDFHVSLDSSVTPIVYNYRTPAEMTAAGKDYYLGEEPFELPGLSVFLREGDRVFHTYSTFGRGLEAPGGTSAYLDLTPLGRQEEWEQPEGRLTGLGAKAGSPDVRYHDEYEA